MYAICILRRKWCLFYTSPRRKKLEKMTQNLSVKPSIFDGLKTRRHVVSHEPSELMSWLLTAAKSNCLTGLRKPNFGQPLKSLTLTLTVKRQPLTTLSDEHVSIFLLLYLA